MFGLGCTKLTIVMREDQGVGKARPCPPPDNTLAPHFRVCRAYPSAQISVILDVACPVRKAGKELKSPRDRLT